MNARLLVEGPLGPQGFAVDAATRAGIALSLNVEVTADGVDVSFGDASEDADDEFSATLTGDGARLLMAACAAYLERIETRAA